MSNQFRADPHHYPPPPPSSFAPSFNNNINNNSNSYTSSGGNNSNNGNSSNNDNPNNSQNCGADYGNSNNSNNSNNNNFDGDYGGGNYGQGNNNNSTYDNNSNNNGNNGSGNSFNINNNSNNFNSGNSNLGNNTYSSQGGDNGQPQQQSSAYPFQQQQVQQVQHQQQQYQNTYQQQQQQQPYIQDSSANQFVDQQRQHQMMQSSQQQYQQQPPNRQFAPDEYSNGYNQQSRQQQQQQQQHQQQDQQQQQQYQQMQQQQQEHPQQQQQQQQQPQQQYRGQNDYSSQEGPTRSHRRGPPMENNSYSVRFNPSRNYNTDSSSTFPSNGASGQFQSIVSMNPMQNEQGTFLSRPRIPGLPCIGCKMSRTPCDGGSPCRSCMQNRVRCHYEGDNNMKFFGIDALQLEGDGNNNNNSSNSNGDNYGDNHSDNHGDNHDNPDNRSGYVSNKEIPAYSFTFSNPLSTSTSASIPASSSAPVSSVQEPSPTCRSEPARAAVEGSDDAGGSSSGVRGSDRVSGNSLPANVNSVTGMGLRSAEGSGDSDTRTGLSGAYVAGEDERFNCPQFFTNGDNNDANKINSGNHDSQHHNSQQQQQYQHQQRLSAALGSGADFFLPTRSRSRSDSGSGSGSGFGSGSGSGSGSGGSRSGPLFGPAGSSEGGGSSSGVGSRSSGVGLEQIIHRISPQIASPITLSDQSLISIPPFQELTQNDRQTAHSKVVLPSFSSMGSSLTSTSSNSTHISRGSSSGRSNSSSSNSASRSPQSQQGGLVQPKSSNDRQLQPAIIPRTLSSDKPSSSPSGLDIDAVAKRKPTKKAAKEQTQGLKDPLYSLSSASIRARKNAHETENIQRASILYADYIAKIKALAAPADMEAVNAVSAYIPENVLSSFSKMDVDMDEPESEPVDQSNDAEPTKTGGLCSGGDLSSECTIGSTGNQSGTSNEKSTGSIEGLGRMGRSGLLHSLVQQYFTLIHPQFMILNKNQFLVKFWMTYGPFPEAREVHVHIMQENRTGHSGILGEQSNDNRGPKILPEFGYQPSEKGPSGPSTSPLLLLAMLALVSRHINDRTPLKSTAEDKNRRIQKSFALIDAEFQTAEQHSQCQNAARESRLQELMETDERGQSEIDHEDLQDRGEQYFHWATELLRAKYEEPSLAVVQSVLLLREYAIMAGNHQQAYMYGGTAITMAMELGWHRAQFASSNSEASSTTPPDDSAEQKSEQEKKKETKAQDDEQWLCWWHCFIVDRWMSVAFNRPVNIPVHIFDKTHLRPLQKPKKLFQSPSEAEVTPSVLSPDFWLTPPGAPDNAQPRPSETLHTLSIGSGLPTSVSPNLPGAQFRARAYFDQQCRQALLLDDILCFLASWSENLFVNSAEFEKLSVALDDWHRALADWQSFPLSGIMNTSKNGQRQTSKDSVGGSLDRDWIGIASSSPQPSTANQDDGRDIVQSTLLGISFHAIRILLYRPFLRTNLRHPPCQTSRASAVCAQSANAMTSLAEYLMNISDTTIQPCLLMRHQFPLVTAAGIQLMNVNLDDEPRLSTPAKINLLKTIRILRDADRSSWGAGVRDGFRQVLGELFPAQMRLMYDDLQ